MEITFVRNQEGFRRLRQRWNALLFASGQSCPFLTHEWFYSWWESFGEGNSLEIVLAEDEKIGLAGIAPLMVKKGALQFMASKEVTDYCDFISLPEYREEFYRDLLSVLPSNRPELVRMELINIPSSSPTLFLFCKMAAEFRLQCLKRESEVVPFLALPPSYEDYMESLSRKSRHELRRKIRKLKSFPGLESQTITGTGELSQKLEEFIVLHGSSSPEKKSFWNTPGMTDFFKKIVRRFSLEGWAEMHVLCSEGRTVASLLDFSYDDKIYFYNMAYDAAFARLSPGYYLFDKALREAIIAGKKEADFLRGKEKYKFFFGSEESKVYNVSLDFTRGAGIQ